MAIYVTGDLQGCLIPLKRLLDQVNFDPANDKVWFAGDLVSRGPDSLEVLRYVKGLGSAAVSVLGNHDISLIAAAYGVFSAHRSLRALLNAPDRYELINWLQYQPLLHLDKSLNAVMVHAGIPPDWKLKKARAHASMTEATLRQPDPSQWLKAIYGNQPDKWKPAARLTKLERQRYTINALTRMRYCHPDGRLEFNQKLNPETVKQTHPELIPWFKHPNRKKFDQTIYFGHWSTLGYYQKKKVVALDTGCVWGGKLTMVRIDTEKKIKYQVACTEYGR